MSASESDPLTPADLVEIERIKRLKYRYMRCLDQKRWDELATCLTADAECSYSAGRYAFSGRERILAFLRQAMDRPSFLSSHRVHQPEIRLASPSTASGVWAMEDWVVDTERNVTIHGAAFYADEYVKVEGAWRIRRTGYERTFEEVIPRAGVRLTASWWETGGRSTLAE
jgi:hypothetical protein